MNNFVTDQMCEALQRLQRVKTYDMPGAYHAALSGLSAHHMRNRSGREMVAGSLLALDLFRNRMYGTAAS
jgi:hypothetical protein